MASIEMELAFERKMAWVPTASSFLSGGGAVGTRNTEVQRIQRFVTLRRSFVMSAFSDKPQTGDYAQFAEMLDAGAAKPGPPSPDVPEETRDTQPQEQEKEKYAEFAKLLGVEEPQSESDAELNDNVIVPAKKAEIDPEDYDIFDSLLRGTGGTGRRPRKGSKRFTSAADLRGVTSPQKDSKSSGAGLTLDAAETLAGEESKIPGKTNTSAFSEEQLEDAYDVMTEEFGSDFHGRAVTKQVDTTPADLEASPIPKLVTPPKRTGAPPIDRSRRSDLQIGSDRISISTKTGTEQGQTPPVELKQKPRQPGQVVTAAEATGNTSDIEKGMLNTSSVWQSDQGKASELDAQEEEALSLLRPPSRPEREAFAYAFSTRTGKQHKRRRQKSGFDAEEAETLTNPKLVFKVD